MPEGSEDGGGSPVVVFGHDPDPKGHFPCRTTERFHSMKFVPANEGNRRGPRSQVRVRPCEGAGNHQRSRVRSRVLVSIQAIRGYEPRPATGPRASRCAAAPPAGVEPAFPASDAGVVSVGPRGLRRLRAGALRRMQESNPRGCSAHPTTVFETAALPLGQSSLARRHPGAAVVRGGRADRTRAATARPGLRMNNPCHSAGPPCPAVLRRPSRIRTSVAGSRVRSPVGWTNGHRVVLPGQGSNLALRNQSPPCCRIHHPGIRALARSRTWTVRILGPVPLPVGPRGRGSLARGLVLGGAACGCGDSNPDRPGAGPGAPAGGATTA